MYTQQQADENKAIKAAAAAALQKVGWTPDPEPDNWQGLTRLAVIVLAEQFPAVPEKRIKRQVLSTMAEYRGYKKDQWATGPRRSERYGKLVQGWNWRTTPELLEIADQARERLGLDKTEFLEQAIKHFINHNFTGQPLE